MEVPFQTKTRKMKEKEELEAAPRRSARLNFSSPASSPLKSKKAAVKSSTATVMANNPFDLSKKTRAPKQAESPKKGKTASLLDEAASPSGRSKGTEESGVLASSSESKPAPPARKANGKFKKAARPFTSSAGSSIKPYSVVPSSNGTNRPATPALSLDGTIKPTPPVPSFDFTTKPAVPIFDTNAAPKPATPVMNSSTPLKATSKPTPVVIKPPNLFKPINWSAVPAHRIPTASVRNSNPGNLARTFVDPSTEDNAEYDTEKAKDDAESKERREKYDIQYEKLVKAAEKTNIEARSEDLRYGSNCIYRTCDKSFADCECDDPLLR